VPGVQGFYFSTRDLALAARLAAKKIKIKSDPRAAARARALL